MGKDKEIVKDQEMGMYRWEKGTGACRILCHDSLFRFYYWHASKDDKHTDKRKEKRKEERIIVDQL